LIEYPQEGFVRDDMHLVGSDDSDSDDGGSMLSAQKALDEAAGSKLLKKAKKKYNFGWGKELGVEGFDEDGAPLPNEKLDLLTDLLDVDMSPVLRKLSSSAIGEIVPYSVSIIGANMAETFNERQFSAMNLIMTTKRTRLSDRQLEILAVLRMNRSYMRAMKNNFPKLALRLSSYHTTKIRKMASA
jgi:hypothetical protein